MKAEDQYLRLVRWSDADGAYVGFCPDLFPAGGVCHATTEEQAYSELCVRRARHADAQDTPRTAARI